MFKRTRFSLTIILVSLNIKAQSTFYEHAYSNIENMLSGKAYLNFKEAVLLTKMHIMMVS